MAIAVFIESYEPIMGAHRRQIMLVPHGSDTRVYMRVTDGLKGPQNAWKETDMDSLLPSLQNTSEFITKEVSGIVVTAADTQAIDKKGYSPVLGTKAVQAHEKAPATNSPVDVATALIDNYELVSIQDEALQTLVVDKRRQPAPYVTMPITPAVVQQQAVQPAQPVHHAAPAAMSAPRTLQLHLASVPRKELADKYVHRRVLNDSIEDFECFDYARSENINVLIYGPTGPGKTTSVEAWSAARNLRMAMVSGNAALEPGHLFGKFIPDPETGGFIWVDGPVTDVVRNGGVLLLDELNFISPKIYTVLYSLLDGRRTITLLDHMGEVIDAHPDLTVFATMNPDYAGTTPLNFAMRNRFDIQIPWDYDDKVESKLVTSKALRVMIKQLRDEAAKGSFETPISTNMLIEFSKFIKDKGFEFACENFVAHFHTDEQPAVRMVVKTHEVNLKEDFGLNKVEIKVETEEKPAEVSDSELSEMLSRLATPQV